MLFASTAIAQNYNGLWQEVDNFTNNAQPKSALEIIEKIHAQAAKDNNSPQVIKAIIHEVKFNAQFEEESLVASIERIKTEAENAPQPTKQILHSLLAEMHWGYFRNNSWHILKRTATENAGDNILTWDFKRIAQVADKHYQLSLANKKVLQNAPLSSYQAILTGSEKYRELRPSLYHLLVSRALDFYSSSERELLNFDPSGIYADAVLLGSSDAFLGWELKTTKGVQPAALTILLYQELLREAVKISPEALVSEDLKRLKFMHSRANTAVADELYETTLRNLLLQHKDEAVAAEVAYQLGNLFHSQGSAISDPTHADYWKYRTADSLCAVYINKFPNTLGARNCKSLSERIHTREWAMNAEGAVLPNRTFRFLLRYKNVGNSDAKTWPVYVRVASIDPILYRQKARQNYGEKLVNWLKSNSETVTEKTFDVPNPQ
ncbi:MAG: hypothetical protein JKX84_08875, partial [Flavobacteriales bacterium]|nr:hypothetical protein [Flavobacteriales bacterium]